jgi:hypothetical protein
MGALEIFRGVEHYFPLGVVLDPMPYVCPGYALPPSSAAFKAG